MSAYTRFKTLSLASILTLAILFLSWNSVNIVRNTQSHSESNIVDLTKSPSLNLSDTMNFTGVSLPRKTVGSINNNDSVIKPNLKTIDIDSLADALRSKLKAVDIEEIMFNSTCASKDTIANSCEGRDRCLETKFPKDLRTRVSQLVTPTKLQLTNDALKILEEMQSTVRGYYDIILVTAASANHFSESVTLMQNLQRVVLPLLRNFTLLYYDLGLSHNQRLTMMNLCRCQMLNFPFHKLPPFIRHLKTYSWKPILIRAHTQQANVVVWIDASIRFKDLPGDILTFMNRARQRGIQIPATLTFSPFRTFRNMYHFFGDEPCMFLETLQAASGLVAYGKDAFVDRVIMEPWVACALREDCMALGDNNSPPTPSLDCGMTRPIEAKWRSDSRIIRYGLCHRYDQASLSIILHKLYQGFYHWVMPLGITWARAQREWGMVQFSEMV